MHVRLLGAAALTACLAAAGCASSPYNDGYYGASAPPTLACYNDCGTVTRIEVVSGGSSVPNATGAVVGAVVGAAAGRELADDESKGRRNTATAVGAVAGALAGNAIQNRVQGDGTYRLTIRLDDGRTTVVTQDDLGAIREGSHVKIYDGRAWAR